MRYFFSFFIILLSAHASAQVKVLINFLQTKTPASSDTIYFNPSRKLVWNDFKGTPEPNHIALAITSSGLGYSAAMKSTNGAGTITINVFCYFDKEKSWVKVGKQSDYALTHEQHHFDVSYLATNLFVTKLKAAKFTLSNYALLLQKIYTEALQNLESMQNAYDGETKNGQLKNIQAVWNKKIDDSLKAIVTH